MYLGEFIYNYRMKNKITLKQFSEKSGLSLAYINQLENNKNPKTGKSIIPSPETFLKAAYAMNMDVDELFRSVDQDQPVHIGTSSDHFLSALEETLIAKFRELNGEGQAELIKQANLLIAGGYIKSDKNGMVGKDA